MWVTDSHKRCEVQDVLGMCYFLNKQLKSNMVISLLLLDFSDKITKSSVEKNIGPNAGLWHEPEPMHVQQN